MELLRIGQDGAELSCLLLQIVSVAMGVCRAVA